MNLDRFLEGCALVAGIVLLLGIVVLAWMLAALTPSVRDILEALK